MTVKVAENNADAPAKASEPLTKLDRCDACGTASRAYSRVSKGALVLLFCNHHLQQHLSKLVGDGWDIDDQVHILHKECEMYKSVQDDNF